MRAQVVELPAVVTGGTEVVLSKAKWSLIAQWILVKRPTRTRIDPLPLRSRCSERGGIRTPASGRRSLSAFSYRIGAALSNRPEAGSQNLLAFNVENIL